MAIANVHSSAVYVASSLFSVHIATKKKVRQRRLPCTGRRGGSLTYEVMGWMVGQVDDRVWREVD